MASTQSDFIWVGEDAFHYLKESYLLHQKIDVILLHAPGDQDSAIDFANLLHTIWSTLVVKHLEKQSAKKYEQHQADAGAEDEGIDVVDCWNMELNGFFPVLPTDCDSCAQSPPKPKIAVLDVSRLLQEDFLEDTKSQIVFERPLLVPLLTPTFLSQPEFVIRSYYLKLAIRRDNQHVLPVVPQPVKVPNFLYDHLSPVRLYKTDKWGRDKPGLYSFVKEQLKLRLIDVLALKIHKRGRECVHRASTNKE